MIPVSDLMQSNHPGYRAFCIGYSMNDVYHPVFFDYCVRVCEVFKRHADSHYGDQIALMTETSITRIIESLKLINETDEPDEVFPLRESIRGDCYEFLKHCDYMSGKFQKPTAMTEFYDMLGDMVMTIAFQHAGVEH